MGLKIGHDEKAQDIDNTGYVLRKYNSFYRVSQKSSTSYFAEYFRAGLTDCKNFNGYRVRDNLRTQVCN